jgi:hypothetical protein
MARGHRRVAGMGYPSPQVSWQSSWDKFRISRHGSVELESVKSDGWGDF